MTSKEKLEQLGWEIKIDEYEYVFTYMNDFITYHKEFEMYDFSMMKNYAIEQTKLQLILDYIKEQENDK